MDIQKPDKKVILPHNQPDWTNLSQILQNPTENGQQLDNLIQQISGSTKVKIFSMIFSNPCPIDCDQFFTKVLPFMKSLVLRLPDIFPEPIFHLVAGQDKKYGLTREQVACLLACSFFGCFSELKYDYPHIYAWPRFDITELYTMSLSSKQFLLCILHYFERISEQMPTGNILIHRKVLLDPPDYKESKKKIINVEITTNLIETFINHSFHADFANCYIGGGVLEGGCVQEEILFVIKPECLVSMLICSKMEKHEAIIITGTEQFSKYSGYAFSMKFDGDHRDQTPRNLQSNYIKNHIVGIDATVCYGGDFGDLLRDINKAYIGIVNPELEEPGEDHPVFVTGHWGCGAFGGNKEIKAVQQIIAASEAGIDLVYSTFNNPTFGDQFQQLISYLNNNNITVGQLYEAFCVSRGNNLFQRIINHLQSHGTEQKIDGGECESNVDEK